MATHETPSVPIGEAGEGARQAVPRPWRMSGLLSSLPRAVERFLEEAEFDRGPWLVVAFASGIGLWFALPGTVHWLGGIGIGLLVAAIAALAWRKDAGRDRLRAALIGLSLTAAFGIALVWLSSDFVGAQPIAGPRFERVDGRILAREEQPSEGRVRLTLAVREGGDGRPLAYRLNLPLDQDRADLREGARIRLSARLMPPSPPIIPGAYNFARRAWFEGLAATGSVVGEVEVLEASSRGRNSLADVQRALSAHVRTRLDGAPGAIAATLASGDRGAIPEADEEAMRDAGLTHLLSISGLHVSAIIAATYLLAMRVLGLWEWLALRTRLPLVAAGTAALAGIGYTLLTGAEVPTVRSCIGAVLVLLALALGREPLTLRMLAIAAAVVLALWPEALVGPSFQMSFAAVLAIVALHNSAPVRAFLAPRTESTARRLGRRLAMLFLTGLVIEFALMPIVLFHFHRAGVYGAGANLLAIPLVTFVAMPLVALGLLMDMFGAGAPVWWLAGQSLDLLLEIAHAVANQPGSVDLAPRIPTGALILYVAGALWLALWQGRARLWGMVAIAWATLTMISAPIPDILVTRDGRDIGIANEGDRLLVLRDGASNYARDNLLELAATAATPSAIDHWKDARCSKEFCAFTLSRAGRSWQILVARNRDLVEERALAAACARSDIVIAPRYLPRSCKPRWLLIDRKFLTREGGVTIYLVQDRVETVAQSEGAHGWWQSRKPRAHKDDQ